MDRNFTTTSLAHVLIKNSPKNLILIKYATCSNKDQFHANKCKHRETILKRLIFISPI